MKYVYIGLAFILFVTFVLLFLRINKLNKTLNVTKDKINIIQNKTIKLKNTKKDIDRIKDTLAKLFLLLSIRKTIETLKELKKEKKKKAIAKTVLTSANKIVKIYK